MMQSMYNKKRGIFFIVAAAFNFSTMNMFARLAGDIPAMQKTFFRNLVAILVISTILLLRRQRITVKKGAPAGAFGAFHIRNAWSGLQFLCDGQNAAFGRNDPH